MYKLVTEKNKLKTGFSQQQTKRNNTMLLFNLIRSKAPISRIHLAELTGLSATTVSLLVEELIASDLIEETGAVDTNLRGRKPIMLEISNNGGCFIVVELLNRGFICSLYDLRAQKIDLIKLKKDEMKKNKITVNDTIYHILEKNGIAKSKLIGVNIIYPGIVDDTEKKLVSSTVLEISEITSNEDIAIFLKENPDVYLMINNTSVVIAYSEYILNSGVVNNTIIEISMYEGIGAGVVVIGAKGECTHNYVMELGHMVIERNGKKCKCGNRGCFEAICGVPAVLHRINEETDLNIIYEEEWGSEINVKSSEIIKEKIKCGDKRIISIIDDVVHAIITTIVNTINMTGARYIFMSGIIVDILEEEHLKKINKEVNQYNVIKGKEDCIVQVSKLNYELIRKGAVYMLMDNIFTFSAEGAN